MSIRKSHEHIWAFLQEVLPLEWRPTEQFRIRKRILSDPDLILKPRRGAARYAIFFTVLPILIAISALKLAWLYGMPTPQQSVERYLKEAEEIRTKTSTLSSNLLSMCIDQSRNDLTRKNLCIAINNDTFRPLMSSTSEWIGVLETAKKGIELQDKYIWEISWPNVVLNVYLFTWLWNKKYRAHVSPNQEDRTRVRQAYLFTLGTTLYVPSLVAAFITFASGLWLSFSPANWSDIYPYSLSIIFIPMAIASYLVPQRLNQMLNDDHTWRNAWPFSIGCISQLITNIVVITLIILIALVL